MLSSFYLIIKTHCGTKSGFENGKYNIAKTILGKHPTPKVQISVFEIQPDKIQCNEPQELYKRDNSNADDSSDRGQTCLTPQTYEKLLKRGADLS